MGATWISWKITVIITVLQIQALMCVKATAVTDVEGHTYSFKCEYPTRWQNNTKFLCPADIGVSRSCLIETKKQNQWVKRGRFSLYDNTTGAFIIIKVDKLVPEDTGTYWCGVDVTSFPDHISVIQLNVDRVTPMSNPPTDLTVDSFNKPFFLTAVMCVAAMLFVCLFTLCLLLTVKHRSSGPRHNRQTSADYVTIMPGAGTELEHYCTCPDCAELSSLSPPPPELCPEFKAKQRESTVTLGIGEYVDVDVPGHICQYQQLDLSLLEENVYHSLHGSHDPKEENHLEVKEQQNC